MHDVVKPKEEKSKIKIRSRPKTTNSMRRNELKQELLSRRIQAMTDSKLLQSITKYLVMKNYLEVYPMEDADESSKKSSLQIPMNDITRDKTPAEIIKDIANEIKNEKKSGNAGRRIKEKQSADANVVPENRNNEKTQKYHSKPFLEINQVMEAVFTLKRKSTIMNHL